MVAKGHRDPRRDWRHQRRDSSHRDSYGVVMRRFIILAVGLGFIVLVAIKPVVADDTRDALLRDIGEATLRVRVAQDKFDGAKAAVIRATSALRQLYSLKSDSLWFDSTDGRLKGRWRTETCNCSSGMIKGELTWFPGYEEVVEKIQAKEAALSELSNSRLALWNLESRSREISTE